MLQVIAVFQCSAGLFYCWYSWLYGAWSLAEERIWYGVWLVVVGGNHVWNAHRLPSFLFWWSKDHMPQGETISVALCYFLSIPCVFRIEKVSVLYQIINWKTCLKLPEEPKISDEAKDLICHLLCDVETRLGTGGVEEIKVITLPWNYHFPWWFM